MRGQALICMTQGRQLYCSTLMSHCRNNGDDTHACYRDQLLVTTSQCTAIIHNVGRQGAIIAFLSCPVTRNVVVTQEFTRYCVSSLDLPHLTKHASLLSYELQCRCCAHRKRTEQNNSHRSHVHNITTNNLLTKSTSGSWGERHRWLSGTRYDAALCWADATLHIPRTEAAISRGSGRMLALLCSPWSVHINSHVATGAHIKGTHTFNVTFPRYVRIYCSFFQQLYISQRRK